MCLGCGHTGVAQALADTIYDFQLPGWLVEINTGIGCGGKLSSQFKAVLSETDEEAREKISDDLLAKIAEEVGTINVTSTVVEFFGCTVIILESDHIKDQSFFS